MRYDIVLIKSAEGYAVHCPALPPCWSQGSTRAEALANIQDAIAEYLDYLSATAAKRKAELVAEGRQAGCLVEECQVQLATAPARVIPPPPPPMSFRA